MVRLRRWLGVCGRSDFAVQDELNRGQDVTLVLSPAEALVLFELLAR